MLSVEESPLSGSSVFIIPTGDKLLSGTLVHCQSLEFDIISPKFGTLRPDISSKMLNVSTNW